MPLLETNPIRMMGLAITSLREDQLVDLVLERASAGEGGWICPVNLDVMRKVVHDPAQRRLVETADVLTADGMPLIWASRLQGTPLPERVAGSSLVLSLPAAGRRTGATVFLLGGDPGVADAAAEELRRTAPGARIVGTHCPPLGFEESPQRLAEIDAELAATQPDVVFVALGFPKQERLIQRLRTRFPTIWFVSCGISLSYLSGDVQRAPGWVQRVGLEWLHRLGQEPRRLARRYLVEGVPFCARLLAAAVWRRTLA